MLTRALETSQNDLDTAANRLGIVESERLDGLARIEESEQQINEIKSQMEKERKEAEDEISSRIDAFHKFEKAYWAKAEKYHSQMGYLGH